MDLRTLCSVLLLPLQILCCAVKASVRFFIPGKRRDLSGDVVLITGGGRGIGRHLAREFAKCGAKKVNAKINLKSTNTKTGTEDYAQVYADDLTITPQDARSYIVSPGRFVRSSSLSRYTISIGTFRFLTHASLK